MSAVTALDSFDDPAAITALYPFVGLEGLFVVVAVVLWVGWHVVQMRSENKEYAEAIRRYEDVGMERAMHLSGSARPDRDNAPGHGTEVRKEPGNAQPPTD